MAFRLVVVAAAALAVSTVVASVRSPARAEPLGLAGQAITGPKIAAAGDIACDPGSDSFHDGNGEGLACRQMATSDLLLGGRYKAVLLLGDIQYEDGSYEKFLESYDPTWGRVRGITRPAPGNHEYETDGAEGYFRYFGKMAGDPATGYYSFDLAGWHLVALNSNCDEVGGCGPGSPQWRWLRADLAGHRAQCTLAYWHHPRYSSGDHGSDPRYVAFWRVLYNAKADVVLVGHDHGYERFAPQRADGVRDSRRGLREFVVGTGGKNLRGFPTVRANSELRDAASFGVLELTLGRSAYAWRFRSAVGSLRDSGSTRCH